VGRASSSIPGDAGVLTAPGGAAPDAAPPPRGGLAGRLRHRGLESPLLPAPAVLAVVVSFLVPLVVLLV
jgi:hypothetical protein